MMRDQSELLNIKSIFEHVQKDTTLLSTLDIPDLLNKIEKSDYLEGKTLQDIQEEKIAVLEGLDLPTQTLTNILEKLTEYRYIKNIFELHKGKHIRWIKLGTTVPSLDRGAILSDIKFTDSGTNLQCLRYDYRVFVIKMDDRILFQKMNTEELLLLAVNEHIKTGKINTAFS